MALLQLDNVVAFYGPIRALKGVSLTIERGEIVCLLGGNASGKSTTMKVILGLVQPKSGTVTFGGETISGLRTPDLNRRGIGSVPEARRLFGAMTVRENLLMGAYLRSGRSAIGQDLERILELFP